MLPPLPDSQLWQQLDSQQAEYTVQVIKHMLLGRRVTAEEHTFAWGEGRFTYSWPVRMFEPLESG